MKANCFALPDDNHFALPKHVCRRQNLLISFTDLMEELTRLWNIRKTVHSMLLCRDYIVSQQDLDISLEVPTLHFYLFIYLFSGSPRNNSK